MTPLAPPLSQWTARAPNLHGHLAIIKQSMTNTFGYKNRRRRLLSECRWRRKVEVLSPKTGLARWVISSHRGVVVSSSAGRFEIFQSTSVVFPDDCIILLCNFVKKFCCQRTKVGQRTKRPVEYIPVFNARCRLHPLLICTFNTMGLIVRWNVMKSTLSFVHRKR